jgi:hypothetical protein
VGQEFINTKLLYQPLWKLGEIAYVHYKEKALGSFSPAANDTITVWSSAMPRANRPSSNGWHSGVEFARIVQPPHSP